MRIAQLSSNVERVPPPGYGGTELVVSLLTEELVARGHEVTLFATGDSETTAELVSVVDHPLRESGEIHSRWQAFDLRLLIELKKRSANFDIVHNHMGYQALPFLDELGIPVVTTLHNLIKPYNEAVYLAYRHMPYVAISNAYKRLNYPTELNYAATIYNGIDISRFQMNGNGRSGDYLLFIGRLCQDKGTGHAIEIAKKLGLPILLAGKVDIADRSYFEDKVEPYLNDDDVTFVGEVDHDQKVQLYKDARAVVYPIAFEEPFGLVMAESLAAGTPVLALDRGSVREVLSDGETAVIGDSVDELVKRFPEIKRISSETCKQRVCDLFSKERMVDSYEELYEKLCKDWRPIQK